jgi:hypothetical protein
MRYPNLVWALAYKGILHCDAARVLKQSPASFSWKLGGRADFAPHEKTRLSALTGYQEQWLFAELTPPASAPSMNATRTLVVSFFIISLL